MDPYLEDAAFWEGFHTMLVCGLMMEIEQGLPDGYISNIKVRTEVIPVHDPAADVYMPGIRRRSSIESIEVREGYIEIQRVPGHELITSIELMSPRSKHGAGIGIHEETRSALVNNGIHFVELDLLRGGARSKLPAPLPEGDYYAMVFRGDRAGWVEVFAWTLRQALPTIPIPLRARDKDVPLNLDRAVHTGYERARYDRKLRYTNPGFGDSAR
jgi:hypothetical protein